MNAVSTLTQNMKNSTTLQSYLSLSIVLWLASTSEPLGIIDFPLDMATRLEIDKSFRQMQDPNPIAAVFSKMNIGRGQKPIYEAQQRKSEYYIHNRREGDAKRLKRGRRRSERGSRCLQLGKIF